MLDLGLTSHVPLQFSATYPDFLIREPELIGDTYDWSHCLYTEIQSADRGFYLHCIEALAPQKGILAMLYAEVLGRSDHEERWWWFRAVSRGDAMRAWQVRP